MRLAVDMAVGVLLTVGRSWVKGDTVIPVPSGAVVPLLVCINHPSLGIFEGNNSEAMDRLNRKENFNS